MFPCGPCCAASTLEQIKRFDLAEQEFQELLTQSPCPGLHAKRAACLIRLGRSQEALAEAQEGIRLGPDRDLTHWAMSVVRMERNELEEAELHALEALRLAPSDARHYCQLADIRFRQKRWQDVLQLCEQGLALDPVRLSIVQLQAATLVCMGRLSDGLAAANTLLALDPLSAWAHALLGEIHMKNGEPGKAMELTKEALRLDPTLEPARAWHDYMVACSRPVPSSRPELKPKWSVGWLLLLLGYVTLLVMLEK